MARPTPAQAQVLVTVQVDEAIRIRIDSVCERMSNELGLKITRSSLLRKFVLEGLSRAEKTQQ